MFFEIISEQNDRLPFLLTSVGVNDFQRPAYRPQGSGKHHVLYVTKGEGVFSLPDGEHILREGQGIFFHMDVPINYASTGGAFSTAWLTFRGSGAQALLDFYGIGDFLLFDVTQEMVEKLIAFEHTIQRKTLARRSADGYAFVLELLEYITMPVSEWPQKVLGVRRYLESHFNEPITLEKLAQEIGSDRFTLCQQYKRQTGTTVMTELRSIRIDKAREMLQSGQVRVCDVGQSCGFDSASYFGKIFREVTGMTPGQYRDRFR